MDAASLNRCLLNCEWKFAKTMPENPHYYTLRKTWNDTDFVDAVKFIRENGYTGFYEGRQYTYWNLNGSMYWTMGAPINKKDGKPCTILINRKEIQYAAEYDVAAPRYDRMFDSEIFRKETKAIMNSIPPAGNVLDVGCGTGLFLEYHNPANYTGIDVSTGMLDVFKAKHPGYAQNIIRTSYDDYFIDGEFDLTIALFGTGSYLTESELKKMQLAGGKKFIMFYTDDYQPVTHIETGIRPKISRHNLVGGKIRRAGNYMVWEQ